MPKGAKYPSHKPHSGEGGNLPSSHRQKGDGGTKVRGLGRPTGNPKGTAPASAPMNPKNGGSY